MLGSRKNVSCALEIQRGYRVDSKVSVYSAETEISLPVFCLLKVHFFLEIPDTKSAQKASKV